MLILGGKAKRKVFTSSIKSLIFDDYSDSFDTACHVLIMFSIQMSTLLTWCRFGIETFSQCGWSLTTFSLEWWRGLVLTSLILASHTSLKFSSVMKDVSSKEVSDLVEDWILEIQVNSSYPPFKSDSKVWISFPFGPMKLMNFVSKSIKTSRCFDFLNNVSYFALLVLMTDIE